MAPKTAAKPEKKTTTSRKSGTTKKPAAITVTIKGELAEEIRKEAESTGMGPLSLVKQRLKFGSLLTQETDEGKQFRMDVAEKTFRDAGIDRLLPPVPAELGVARLRQDDAIWINAHFRELGSDPWIVAGVLAVIGSESLHDESAACKTGKDCNALLWRVIHREEAEFTMDVPVFVAEAEYEVMADSAHRFRRYMADWLGTLIQLGIWIYKSRKGLEFMTDFQQFNLLARSAELEFVKERRES